MSDTPAAAGRAKIWAELTQRGDDLKRTTAARAAGRKRLNTAVDHTVRGGVPRAGIRIYISEKAIELVRHRLHDQINGGV